MHFSWINHDMTTITIRLITAAVLSGLIGLEREVKRHPAGFRTHLLVGVGACMLMVLSLFGFNDFLSSDPNIRYDPSRLPSYVISGIGFLGAGTIMVHGITVRGLTTAASIWVVSGIGLVVGSGMYFVAVFTTIIVISSLIFLNKWEHYILKTTQSETLYLIVSNNNISATSLVGILEKRGISILKMDVENMPDSDDKLVKYSFVVHFPKNIDLPAIYDDLSKMSGIYKVYTRE
ncbi:MgtC/SapB family protein [Tuberibacillus calidus]|uniref:MgtC/SapB family protein n=1 Tax=Tuberibacillus calidus TaxID=340097 RepID=UPI000416C891|nr:MgtC/SapB family protein [Tuberibacillus calidus]